MSGNRSPWSWIPTLYTAEGIPYVVINTLTVVMYTNFGMSVQDVAYYTSWLYLPWVIKPFWSPFVDIIGKKRTWIWAMQFLVSILMLLAALCIQTEWYVYGVLAFLWVCAFASATHDIAADGFYILALNSEKQSFFAGIRNTFYRIATVICNGGLVMLAGELSDRFESVPLGWTVVFILTAAVFGVLSVYHLFMLPNCENDTNIKNSSSIKSFFSSFGTFFLQDNIILILLFIFTYRLGEAQLVKITAPFLLDTHEAGGLALTTKELGFAYGTIGTISLTIGGIIGGIVVSKKGLRKCLMSMILAMNIPNLVYVYMAWFCPENRILIDLFIAIEQFGYGYGFTAFTLFLIKVSKGQFSTSHYAICTGLMALGMMIPGMCSGYINNQIIQLCDNMGIYGIGYTGIFVWICICTIPAFIIGSVVYNRFELD